MAMTEIYFTVLRLSRQTTLLNKRERKQYILNPAFQFGFKIHIRKTKNNVDFVTARPKIKIFGSTVTVIPGNKGDNVTLICTFSGNPRPRAYWKRQLNGTDLSVKNDSYVQNISQMNDTSTMKVTVNNTGEQFHCVASNLLGSDNLRYTTRRRGK